MTQQEQFIQNIAATIQKEAKAASLKWPSAIIAQACLESGYGTSKLSQYNNFFGLKLRSNENYPFITISSTEYKQGEVKSKFRTFTSAANGIKGYFQFLFENNNKRYLNLREATSAQDYLEIIVKDGYCSNPTYVSSCLSIIKRYNLSQYDLDYEQAANDVINGKYGNGAARITNLKKAGYDPQKVQKIVDEYMFMYKFKLLVKPNYDAADLNKCLICCKNIIKLYDEYKEKLK